MANKRLASMMLAIFMLIGLLAGCGTTAGQNSAANPVGGISDDTQVIEPGLTEEPEAQVKTVPWGEVLSREGLEIPEWDGEKAWVVVNDNWPGFTELLTEPVESYSDLDELGRCGEAYAVVCQELMPTDSRGEIGSVKPSGWHTVRYNDLISGNYLYNRCHLIGFQLAGENANPKNLITGTRYLNIDGMLDFEDAIATYVKSTGGHVVYRVTPIFVEDELVARGVQMEGYSVEDNGKTLCFNVFAYNVQPGVIIDWATGESWRADGRSQTDVEQEQTEGPTRKYVVNTNSGKFHLPECQYASSISEANRLELSATLQSMLDAGYDPCGSCKPQDAN